jgi:hypothetical protein
MFVNDLFLGEIEGSEEFNNKDNIDNLYFMGISHSEIDQLISGKKRYVHGYKGTGKTSLIKLLENQCNNKDIPHISLSYRKVREDAEIINEFREKFRLFKDQFNEEEDKDTTTLTFWKWYLLSLIAKQFIQTDISDLIYSTKQRFFRSIASVLDMLVVTVDPIGNINFGIKLQTTESIDDQESIANAARSIRILSKKLSEKLNRKVILFVDEVELTKARSTYGIDRTMIKNLIIATKHINEISMNLHVIIALRDEVIYDLRGDEINKLIDNFGVKLTWWTNPRVTIDHPLWRLMFKKIRFSMRNYENPDKTDVELWDRWFPFKIANKESWKFFFELTWARPRDFVRLLNLMRNQCMGEKCFTRKSYNFAMRMYSQSALSEISEEISTLFDETIMAKLQKTIQDLGINFTPHSFYEEARKKQILNPSAKLDEMYRVGVVGNHYPNQYGTTWRFFYRNDVLPDVSKPFEVHRALHDAFGIKGSFKKTVYYSY